MSVFGFSQAAFVPELLRFRPRIAGFGARALADGGRILISHAIHSALPAGLPAIEGRAPPGVPD
jgi:hypothetical protein